MKTRLIKKGWSRWGDRWTLSGRSLREATCLAMGWTREGESGELFRSPGGFVRGWYELPKIEADLGDAMSLLLGLDVNGSDAISCGWGITHSSDGFEVYSEWQGEALATGSKSEAASVICRAYLKLVNRGA